MRDTRPRNLWIGMSLVVLMVQLLASPLPLLQDMIWWVFALVTAAMIAIVARRKRLWAKSAWGFVSVGMVLFVLTDVFSRGTSTEPTSPGAFGPLENVLHAASFIFFSVAAVIFVNRRRRTVADIGGLLDSAIVFVGASMIAAEFFVYPLWSEGTLNGDQRTTLVLFEILNVLLLSLTVRLWFSTDRIVNRSARILSIGFLLLVVTDAIGILSWLPSSPIESRYANPIVESAAIIFISLAGSAALDPTAARPPAIDTEAVIVARSRVLFLLGVAVLVPPVLLLLHRDEGTFSNGRAFVLATLALTVLLVLRVNLLVQGYREAIFREHTLREINAGLMRTSDIHEVNGRLSDWAGRLVEQPDVTCVLGTDEELEASGTSTTGQRFRLPNGQVRYRTVVSVSGTTPRRQLVVEAPNPIQGAAQSSLAVLGQSVGMALERLALARRVVERATTERLQLLLHNASDVIALVDGNLVIRYVTEAIRDLTGQSPINMVGRGWPSLFQDAALARGLLDRAKAAGEARGDLVLDPLAIRVTLGDEVPHTDGTAPDRRVEIDVSWLSSEGQFVVTHHDVTDRYVLEQELAFQAFHDELTGLNNRAVFRTELVRASTRARRSGSPFAVLMIDLDDFKDVNDSLGHPAGDQLLKEVARRLVECMREGDTPVRLGGDEFAVILESAGTLADAETVANRFLDGLSQATNLLGTEVSTSASIGIAMSDGAQDTSEVERDADIALYDAKFAGKGRVAIFHTDMHDTAVLKLSVMNQLRGALTRDEMIVKYQPIFDLETGAIAGVEALVRWNHPTRGELVPDMFIALAEETGQIIEIGQFVIRRSLEDLARWTRSIPAHRDLRMSVNVSGRQLANDDVAAVLEKAIASSKVVAEHVLVEVTESVLVAHESVAASQLLAIDGLGASVYIDDFGTGWASLHYLRSLPVSGLKLAQEFVAGLPNEFDGGLVKAIKDLSSSMHLEGVIAEGVETEVQKSALLSMGYRLAQGYLLARPLSSEQLVALLQTTPAASWELTNRHLPIA
ncbi:MAG: EAL domain-containing protein [Candidatus Nanopelagicales bacterium]